MAKDKLKPGDMIYSDSLDKVFKFVQYLETRYYRVQVTDMYGKSTRIKNGDYRLASDKEIAAEIAEKITRANTPNGGIGGNGTVIYTTSGGGGGSIKYEGVKWQK